MTPVDYRIGCGIALAFVMPWAAASNGLNDIGYGASSMRIGGADTAAVRDTGALMINPARLTELDHRQLDLYMQPTMLADNRHIDSYGNDLAPSNRYSLLVGAGHTRPFCNGRCVLGLGLFAQGGAGFVYEDMHTAFGTQDELSSLIGSVRLASGIGWKIDERWSVGLSAGINYSIARQKFFPDTSVNSEQAQFAGFRLDGAHGISPGVRLGVSYDASPTLILAAAYSPQTQIKLRDGTLRMNYDAFGFGQVTYSNCKIEGLAFASDVSVGAAWKPRNDMQLAAEVAWLDWSRAMRAATISASGPGNDNAPTSQAFVSEIRWRDQFVFSAGLNWSWTSATVVGAGINYARNQSRQEYLSPTLALIPTTTLTAGASRTLNERVELNLTAQYTPERSERYTNPDLPFGENTGTRFETFAMLVGFAYRW